MLHRTHKLVQTVVKLKLNDFGSLFQSNRMVTREQMKIFIVDKIHINHM